MPRQIFQVLRCYKCAVFQVHQAKKSNKWACKMCDEKQSFKRHYGIGTGKECRLHVQRLNGIRGDLEDSKTSLDSDSDHDDDCNEAAKNLVPNNCRVMKSKWSNFVEDEPEQSVEETSSMYPDDVEIVLEPQKKRKYGRAAYRTSKFLKHHSAYNNLSDGGNQDKTSKFATNTRGYNSGIDEVDIDYEVKETHPKKKKFVPPTILTITENIEITDYQSNTISFNELPNRFSLKPKQMQPLNNSKHYEECKTNTSPSPKNKHTKWAQYVDEEVSDDDDSSVDNEVVLTADNIYIKSVHTECSNIKKEHHDKKEKLQTLFTLSDDYDLDNVLNF